MALCSGCCLRSACQVSYVRLGQESGPRRMLKRGIKGIRIEHGIVNCSNCRNSQCTRGMPSAGARQRASVSPRPLRTIHLLMHGICDLCVVRTVEHSNCAAQRRHETALHSACAQHATLLVNHEHVQACAWLQVTGVGECGSPSARVWAGAAWNPDDVAGG